MSRHRKVKALDYDEEYDDYYGEHEDDFDDNFDGEAFEAQYLNTGIDLNKSESNNFGRANKNRQTIIDEINRSNSLDTSNPTRNNEAADLVLKLASDQPITSIHSDNQFLAPTTATTLGESPLAISFATPAKNHLADGETLVEGVTSNLTRLAIQHLDKHQWQLPLMEMDKKFRDRTYYKHYTDTYISSLRSKLGQFLTDNQLQSNPMRYHIQSELDNYSKYSRMFELLTDYYQSLGSGFFSFATPSPDEEIVIGCRRGTKAKKSAKPVAKTCDNQSKTTRFEYHGKPSSSSQPSSSKSSYQGEGGSGGKSQQGTKKGRNNEELTIQENFSAEQLDKLTKQYKDSLNVETKKSKQLVPSTTKPKSKASTAPKIVEGANNSSTTKEKKAQATVGQPRQLQTLVEKRHNLKEQLKRNAEPSQQDREAFKRQALQTTQEYQEHVRSTRPRVNLVVVGHVDAGKSTLVGHLLFKLGQISGKQMHRFEVDSQRSGKASFKYAWALDETSEERARGVTIDIALTQFETPNRDVVLLDAPGHVDFIPAVISGAAQADAALLIVDATRGEFETGFTSGGQTREHTFLVRSLGVKSLVVVVNKMDNVDWSWDRFSDIVEQLKPFLKQVGFSLGEDVQFVACSGLSGENLLDRAAAEKSLKKYSHPQLELDADKWKTMSSLIEAIDKIKQPERQVDKPTRVCLTDVFKGMSSGVFVGARVASGKIEAKQKLLLLPPNEVCEVKQVEVRDSRATKAFAGDIVTATLLGVDMQKYYRGCILSDPLIPCRVTNRFQSRIVMFQNANTILLKGSPIEVHINGTYESGLVRKMISLLSKSTGELVQRRPRCITKGSSAIIQLKLERVVCCELYEDNRDLGRFMLRAYGKTIAAGLITKIKSAKVEKRGSKMKSK